MVRSAIKTRAQTHRVLKMRLPRPKTPKKTHVYASSAQAAILNEKKLGEGKNDKKCEEDKRNKKLEEEKNEKREARRKKMTRS